MMQQSRSRPTQSAAAIASGPHSVPAIRPMLRRICRRYAIAARLLCAGAFAVLATPFVCGDLHAQPAYPAAVAASDPYAAFIIEAAQRFAIPASWLCAVMQVESGGNAKAVSPKGAMGLMQLMPTTWSALRLRYHLGNDPFDPHDNILAGAAYLRELFDRFGAPGFLAAYNAGPKGFEDYLAGLRPLQYETRRYLSKLAQLLPDLPISTAMTGKVSASDLQTAGLFVASPSASSQSNGTPLDSPSDDTPPRQRFALSPRSNGLFVPVRMTHQR